MAEIREMAGILARIDDPVLIEGFLRNMLTRNEIREISGRWALVKLLDQGMSQRTVARKLRMSLCKITRGSKELKKRNSCLKRVLDRYVHAPEHPAGEAGGTTNRTEGEQ